MKLIDDFRRYAAIIREMITEESPFAAESESATAVQVERGEILCEAMVRPGGMELGMVERLIELTRGGNIDRAAFVDRSGHHRPVYRPLAIFGWLAAFSELYEDLPREQFGRWEEALRAWSDLLEAELGELNWEDSMAVAARGASATEACWTARALNLAGKIFVRDAWTDLASHFFGKLTQAQQPSGAYLEAHAQDNPDAHSYHELAILHAAAGYAAETEDRAVASTVVRGTAFHLAHTQPDHATDQPFGLFAFIWNKETHMLADEMLHAVRASGAVTGVRRLVLADTLRSIHLFTVGRK